MNRQPGQEITKPHSSVLNQKVILQIEEGKYSKSETGSVYGIDPEMIHHLLKSFDKFNPLKQKNANRNESRKE